MAGPLAPPPRQARGILRVAGVVALALVMVAAGGVALFHSNGPGATGTEAAGSRPVVDRPVVLSGTIEQAVASLQQRLRAIPADWQAWANLGLAYVQQA